MQAVSKGLMGDEELNFTEEEARYWADDPRNQAQEGRTLSRALAVWFLLVIAALVFLSLVASNGIPREPGSQPVAGSALPAR